MTAAFQAAAGEVADSVHASSTNRDGDYAKEDFGTAADDPQAVFDKAKALTARLPGAEHPDGTWLEFDPNYVVGACSNSSCDSVSDLERFSSIDYAIKYANGSPDRAMLLGYTQGRVAYVTNLGTHSMNYRLMAGRNAGLLSSMSNVSTAVVTMAHETGHLYGIQHGADMWFREQRWLEGVHKLQ